jgi:tRNA modification GTPase
MRLRSTICALATSPGEGGIAVVRLSGPDAYAIGAKVFVPIHKEKSVLNARGYTALFGHYLLDGQEMDETVALFYRAPHSYTGEDVIELSVHGGSAMADGLQQALIAAGAVPAAPGEFTRRAFLNGKMDLAQAEAVMGLISASGEQARKAALAGSTGVLSRKIESIKQGLLEQAAHLAAWADFPEEDVPQVEEAALLEGIRQGEAALEELLQGFDRGRMYREGLVTVIAGRPNAGKSTLMNLLSGCQRSIVTQYAGTTRDVVEETVMVAGVPLRLADTAGIRDTDDPVESIGVQAARQRLETAQLVLAVFDSSQALEKEDWELMDALEKVPAIAIVNKSDLPTRMDVEAIQRRFEKTVSLSAATGEGLAALEQALSEILDTKDFHPQEGVLFTQRQRMDAQAALDSLREGEQALVLGLTLDAVTVCVEDALHALAALTGEQVSEEIVDRVFEEFCVGK